VDKLAQRWIGEGLLKSKTQQTEWTHQDGQRSGPSIKWAVSSLLNNPTAIEIYTKFSHQILLLSKSKENSPPA